MAFVTYILRCADDSLYIGWTKDMEARLREHNNGTGARYTRSHGPVRLEISWEFASKSDAMSVEWRLKQLSRKQKLTLITGKALIEELIPEVCNLQGVTT